MDNLSKRISEKDGHVHLLNSMDVRISARNQLKAEVSKIEKGTVESEIFLKLPGNETIMAVITNDSLNSMNIKTGMGLYAIFKANALTVSDNPLLSKSGMNRFVGNIIRIERDSFNAEVIIELKGTSRICSTISIETLDELGLKKGMQVSAFCKPKSIILGIW